MEIHNLAFGNVVDFSCISCITLMSVNAFQNFRKSLKPPGINFPTNIYGNYIKSLYHLVMLRTFTC